MMPHAARSNFDLEEEIRSYWSDRSVTFDLSAGHRISPGAEEAAWEAVIAKHLGSTPLRILELACGTGETTRILHGLGHEVTALDFSEAMLAQARAKLSGRDRLRFILSNAQNTMEPDAGYDAIVCRHLVWTLTDPDAAFRDWHRVLRPNGKMLVFDGNWASPTPIGRLAKAVLRFIDRTVGEDGTHHSGMAERHEAIMRALPFDDGLSGRELLPRLGAVGFSDVRTSSYGPIARAQRSGAGLRDRLRTIVYRRFVLEARRDASP